MLTLKAFFKSEYITTASENMIEQGMTELQRLKNQLEHDYLQAKKDNEPYANDFYNAYEFINGLLNQIEIRWVDEEFE